MLLGSIWFDLSQFVVLYSAFARDKYYSSYSIDFQSGVVVQRLHLEHYFY